MTYYSSQIQAPVTGCTGLIIRKDQTEPATEVHTMKVFNTEGEYRLLKLDIAHATPDAIKVTPGATEVLKIPEQFYEDDIF